MRVVWSWLRELVELTGEVEPQQAALALTSVGLEVEEVVALADDFSDVVVAEVTAKKPHPNADRLTVVDVIDQVGGPATQVVCGANNVPEPGGRVLWARPGAVLPGGMKIGTRALKGVESAGMLCSERELNFGEDHDGIVVLDAGARAASELGAQAQDTLGLRDVVFDISAPANRPDVLGHLGVARELVACVGGTLVDVCARVGAWLEAHCDAALHASELVTVELRDERCTRYTARVVDGVAVARSPLWLRQRLRAVGVRPLSNLVDITNYVMFELGQPLHAFDYQHVRQHHIEVRAAHENETIKTLDDQLRELTPAELVIADGERAVAVAGVMGGADTEVCAATTRVLLESASFDAKTIRKSAKRLGLHSESSHRFERGVDPNVAHVASARAAQLMAQLAGGRVATGIVDVYPSPAKPTQVTLRPRRASALIGIDVTVATAKQALARLGLDAVEADQQQLVVTCPTSRPDLQREVDLIEEVLRVHGIDKIPATLPHTDVAPVGGEENRAQQVRRALVACGMCEAITFGFTSPVLIDAFRLPTEDWRNQPIALRNPMTADHSVMRTMLLPNLVAAVARNWSYGVRDIALFEIGSVFRSQGADHTLPQEPVHLAGVVAGQRAAWLQPPTARDFYDAKGCIEHLMSALGVATEGMFQAVSSVPYFHPGLCAEIRVGGGVIGHVGEIHPETRERMGLEQVCFGWELSLEGLPDLGARQMSGISKFPAVSRDVSVFVDEPTPAMRVRATIREAQGALVEDVQVREEYRDASKVPTGKKGMLWSITYRSHERTLTDAEVDAAHEAIVSHLVAVLPAERR